MADVAFTTNYPATPSLARWLVMGFIAGALSVFLFHQGAVVLMNALEWTDRAPYSMAPTRPFGLPQVWSLAFWGGAWGVVLAALLRFPERVGIVSGSVVLGAILPTLVAWFVVAPLKGQPVAAGFSGAAMAFGVIVNAAWGLGTGIGLALFGRQRASERRRSTEDRRRGEERRRGELTSAF